MMSTDCGFGLVFKSAITKALGRGYVNKPHPRKAKEAPLTCSSSYPDTMTNHHQTRVVSICDLREIQPGLGSLR